MKRHVDPLQPESEPTAGRKLGATALGAVALGAFALGALAIGYLAIGRLSVGRARIGRIEIDELVVKRIRRPAPRDEHAAVPAKRRWRPQSRAL